LLRDWSLMMAACYVRYTAVPNATTHSLIVPRHRRTNFGRRAFTVSGPTAWNSLPDYLRDPSRSEDTFRQLLKTYLFALY